MKKPTVTVIPATVSPNSPQANLLARRRVAAYARVSTDSDEQLTSYEAQVDYYTKHIQSNPEWQFIKVYSDEGISATSTKKRDGFNEMVEDSLDGKIDLIITKSISRFARNTVDSLTTVRKLKEKGVEIYFEKENIFTLDSKGELLITIMSSVAQEESRSISENVTWGARKRMADGKVFMSYKHFLGYEKGPDGPRIVESEAKVIRRIYSLFLEGKTIREICVILTGDGIATPGGKTDWRVSTVKSILSNEKYTGNAILQKRYTVDFLSKTTKRNEGEVPQYYVKNSHPAIIDATAFELAQAEMARRGKLGKQFGGNGLFSCKIICGQCADTLRHAWEKCPTGIFREPFYGPKVWHSADKYRRVVWQCNRKYGEKLHCNTPHLNEGEIQQLFVTAFNRIMAGKGHYLADCEAQLRKLEDVTATDKESAALQSKCSEMLDAIQFCVRENALSEQNQEEYIRHYDALVARYQKAKKRLDALGIEKQARAADAGKIRRFLDVLHQTDSPVTDFDSRLWCAAVESVTVYSKEKIVVTFTGGTEIHIKEGGR